MAGGQQQCELTAAHHGEHDHRSAERRSRERDERRHRCNRASEGQTGELRLAAVLLLTPEVADASRRYEAFTGPHMQQPHMQAFLKTAETFLSGKPQAEALLGGLERERGVVVSLSSAINGNSR